MLMKLIVEELVCSNKVKRRWVEWRATVAASRRRVTSVRNDECRRLHCVVRITAVLISFTRLTSAAVATQHVNGICQQQQLPTSLTNTADIKLLQMKPFRTTSTK